MTSNAKAPESTGSTRPATTAQAQHPAKLLWNWVPIRLLSARQRPRILAHLLALSEEDRYLRFGYAASEAQLSKYVDMLDFDQDEIFGIFNRRLDLIAMAHLAYPSHTQPAAEAELGVSVLAPARGRGFGQRLFDHAILHARNRGVHTLYIHALSENAAMLKIARNAGATIVRAGPESDARLALPEDTVASHMGEIVSTQAAEFDYHLKRHAFNLQNMLDGIAELKTQLESGAPIARE